MSKEYGISRATLLRYINLDDSNSSKKYLGRKAVFTPSEEKDLAKYILDCSKMFHGLSLIKTRELAFTYAVNLKKEVPKNWLTDKMAGKDWLDGCRRRNANLSLRSPEGTSLGRATAFNRTTVSEYFDNIESIMKKYNFSPDCIYNTDETGNTTVQKVQKVLAEKGSKQLGQVTSAERGHTITMVACVSAVGQSLPPAYIFPRVHFKSHMLNGAPPGSAGFATPSGWMSNELFPQTLAHFIQHMSKDKRKLVLLDNHASHTSMETIEKAREHNVKLVTFPPTL